MSIKASPIDIWQREISRAAEARQQAHEAAESEAICRHLMEPDDREEIAAHREGVSEFAIEQTVAKPNLWRDMGFTDRGCAVGPDETIEEALEDAQQQSRTRGDCLARAIGQLVESEATRKRQAKIIRDQRCQLSLGIWKLIGWTGLVFAAGMATMWAVWG